MLPRGTANRHGSKKEDGEDKNFQDHTTACENIDDISTEVLKAGMYLSVSVSNMLSVNYNQYVH